MNLNERQNKQPNVVTVKQEAPEEDDIPLQNEKLENVSTDDQYPSTSLNTFDADVMSNRPLELKSETGKQDCWLKSVQKIFVKEEFLHEEFDIKNEDEVIAETYIDDEHNLGKKLHKHKCNICDYSTEYNNNLKSHLRTHTGEKPFKCNICNSNFGHNSNLQSHLKTHTGNKPFKCNICDYSCAVNSALKKHLRTHTGEKPFKCNICDFNFGRNSDLKNHLRIHTGEKPFKCKICDSNFTRNSDVKSHLRTHTGEKPFECNICEYSCGWKSALRRHLRRHTGEKRVK